VGSRPEVRVPSWRARAAAYLFGSTGKAWTGFRRPGVGSQSITDELAALTCNPYRYVAGGLCDRATSMVEHLEGVFELVLVMLLAWPADGCPFCSYFDTEVPDFDDEDCTARSCA
jgi:hypothetical protein